MSVIAIRGGTVLTIDAERRVIAPGGVLIEDDCIAWVRAVSPGSPSTSRG